MSNATCVVDRFKELKERVLRWERIAGVYILEAAEVPSDARHGAEQAAYLRSFASGFGFSAPDVGEAVWGNAEVFREDARQHIVDALVGGLQIGHSRWDVPPAEAETFADGFLALFGNDARFFCNADPAGHAQWLSPYAYPDFDDYIFGGGCVAVDEHIAAVFWMLDVD